MSTLFATVASFLASAAPWPWENFAPHELACPCRRCGGRLVYDFDFMEALQAVREAMGAPIKINSGHRCYHHNEAVGGAGASQHQILAADISVYGHDRHRLRAVCEAHGFTGIGLGETFLHIDRRAVPAVWDYGKGSRMAWGIKG